MKNVFFVTYYWPPSGKASLHWPLKIIKHLPSFGWQPSVLTIEQDTFSQRDLTFINDIPEEVKVFKAKTFEPFDIYRKLIGKGKNDELIASETISKKINSFSHKLSIWIRMNLFIPDARVGWYFPAVRKGSEVLQKEKVNAIVTIGPPHTTHLVGKKLSSKFNLAHVPVLIDPWTDISYYREFKRSQFTKEIDNKLEKSVLENSAAIVFITNTMREDYVKKYPSIKDKSNVLYWGYSDEDFRMDDGKWKTEEGKEAVILHAGNIFDYQNPKKFWKTIRNELNTGRKLNLVFIGTVSPEIKQSITDAELDSYTKYKGFLPYKEMLKEMMKADYLLVCATEPRHVPGKLFEYLRAGKPIIAFGDGNEEVKKILFDTNAGKMYGYNEGAEEFFRNLDPLVTNLQVVKKFERQIIANHLSIILNKTCV